VTLVLFSVTSDAPVPAMATIFVWGILAFALISPLQMRVAGEASQAPNLASTINIGAFNFGNAIGAWIGAVALIHGEPYDRLPWIGAALAAAALALTIVSYRLSVMLVRPACAARLIDPVLLSGRGWGGRDGVSRSRH
jgi:MFS transporter, DHA1 family, inner membrane transport protein